MQIWYIDMSMVGMVAAADSLIPVSSFVRLKFNQTQKPEETKNYMEPAVCNGHNFEI
jgi:hypothetical protein